MNKPCFSWAPAWIALILLVFLAGCEGKNKYAQPPPPKVTVAQPGRKEVTDYLEFTGNTQSLYNVQLTARVQGYLEKMLFADGDWVKKGQLLFVIEQAPYRSKLQQAQGQLEQAKAQLDHAEKEFRRYSDLLQQHAAAQTDVENWRFQLENAKGTLKAAEATRDLAQLDLSYTEVTAPFDGRIDRRLVDPGNLVGAGGNTALAVVSQFDPIYAYFTINEDELLRRIKASGLSPGEAEKLKIPVDLGLANEEGYPHHGILDYTGLSVTSTTGTLLLRAIFRNEDHKILPGLYCRVRVQLMGSRHQALMLPETSISYDQQGAYVLLADAKNTVERRGVKLGAQQGELRVIEEGLSGEEWVIVSGLLRAIPGATVEAVRQSQSPQANPGLKAP